MSYLSFIPKPHDLTDTLKCGSKGATEQIIEDSLLLPLRDFLNRPSKKFRQELVFLACQMAVPDSKQKSGTYENKIKCELGAQTVEAIHSASLIVDDIEDGSLIRRGHPTLHIQYGIPLALNAGNWLYFWSLMKISHLKLESDKESALLRDTIDIMLKAHIGQSIDIGICVDKIPQELVKEVCLSSISLKTGALMSLAMRVGGYIGGASSERIESLAQIGSTMGALLQTFDDIGNFSRSNLMSNSKNPKQYEDLILRRPSWIWAFASSEFNYEDYRQFILLVNKLPEVGPLLNWLERNDFVSRAKKSANLDLLNWTMEIQNIFAFENPLGVQGLLKLAEEMARSYG